jgi:hypothetical protein
MGLVINASGFLKSLDKSAKIFDSSSVALYQWFAEWGIERGSSQAINDYFPLFENPL